MPVFTIPKNESPGYEQGDVKLHYKVQGCPQRDGWVVTISIVFVLAFCLKYMNTLFFKFNFGHLRWCFRPFVFGMSRLFILDEDRPCVVLIMGKTCLLGYFSWYDLSNPMLDQKSVFRMTFLVPTSTIVVSLIQGLRAPLKFGTHNWMSS